MLKKYTLICLALVCFNTQAQTKAQSEWDRNLNVLAETLPMFDIKIYESSNPDIAVKIKNYNIEDNFLVVSVWERTTRESKRSVFNLSCLKEVDITCKASCTLTLVFDKAVASTQNNKKTQIEIVNCEVLTKNNCQRLTWKPNDHFVHTTRKAFQELSEMNKFEK